MLLLSRRFPHKHEYATQVVDSLQRSAALLLLMETLTVSKWGPVDPHAIGDDIATGKCSNDNIRSCLYIPYETNRAKQKQRWSRQRPKQVRNMKNKPDKNKLA